MFGRAWVLGCVGWYVVCRCSRGTLSLLPSLMAGWRRTSLPAVSVADGEFTSLPTFTPLGTTSALLKVPTTGNYSSSLTRVLHWLWSGVEQFVRMSRLISLWSLSRLRATLERYLELCTTACVL